MIRAFLKKVGLLSGDKAKAQSIDKPPLIIPRSEHNISRSNISENALKVLYRLHRSGFDAYLVGGGVRDLLLGLHPKDFDVATNAKPEEVKRIFRNCRLIGRRFRLAHIYFGYDIIEVATFRGKADDPSQEHAHSSHGMILRDNVYGTLTEDVWRRDFTINALYYNIADFSIIDYVGGMADLKAKRIRMIGDVATRYREDPVRMLRAIRFACKVNFELTPEITQPIIELKGLLDHVSPARLFEEILKMFHSGVAQNAYQHLKRYALFEVLFPATHESLQQAIYPTDAFLNAIFQSTDNRIQEQKNVTPSFIIAALLWHPICRRTEFHMDNGMPFFPARAKAIEEMLQRQAERLSIPKRLIQGAREIWMLQMQLPKRRGRRAYELIEEPRFRAAYDFLELRAKAKEPVSELAKWWKEFVEGDEQKRNQLIKAMPNVPKKKKRKKPKKSENVPVNPSRED